VGDALVNWDHAPVGEHDQVEVVRCDLRVGQSRLSAAVPAADGGHVRSSP